MSLFWYHYRSCECRTCLLAGGPCATQESPDKLCCSKCTIYEKIDRDYLKEIKRHTDAAAASNMAAVMDSSNDASQPILGAAAIENDTEDCDEEDWIQEHGYHLAWALFKHLPGRKSYRVASRELTTPNVKSFCTMQEPPCSRNECRVATHIIAGLYPLSFAKFLLKAYQPLQDEDRSELMSIQKIYLSYLMQKLCDDKSRVVDPLEQMDLLWNSDEADYSLFCDIGSAFAECYLTDIAIPVHDLLDSCFLVENGDINMNMYWLECIYLFKESESWPFKNFDNDKKSLELHMRMQLDQLNSFKRNKVRAQDNSLGCQSITAAASDKSKSAIAREKARIDSWSDEIESLCDTRDKLLDSPEFSATPNFDAFLESIRLALTKNSDTLAESEAARSAENPDSDPITAQEFDDAVANALAVAAIGDAKKLTESARASDELTKSDGVTVTSDGAGCGVSGGKLADAVKIAVKQKLNQ